ncbi:Transforming growth factor beta regulator 1 [Stylophora pistillata]|uniref:Transforming growth factor beta regulator 1 n=1 Tax=Stylophora pistillata TaxID=50429 RepID=A0A2B4SXQ7_STYPI|nr:Transforming growth factor beta regulator 1 [Stylophora pistillata]
MLSPTALNMFSPSPASSEDIGSSALFPSLDPGLSTSGMTSEEIDEQPEGEETEFADAAESATAELLEKTLLRASEQILLQSGGKLHVKDIADGIVESGLIPPRISFPLQTFRESSRFKRIDNRFGWFALMEVDVDEDDDDEDDDDSMDNETTEGDDQVIEFVIRLTGVSGGAVASWLVLLTLDRVVQENGALCDEVQRTEAKFQRAKAERKFILKRLFQYQAAAEAGMFQAAPYPPFSPDMLPPMMFPPFVPENAKPPKVKAKKTPVKPKTEKEPKSSGGTAAKAQKAATESTGKDGLKEKEKPARQEKKKPAKPKKPKAQPENSVPSAATAAVAAASAAVSSKATTVANQGTPPVKPKRKKPGTAIKRKVQPIAVDAKGKPIFPIVLGGLTVHSLGEIVHDRPGFHSERYIWPVGYCSSRTYPSMRNPEKKCIYTCKILDGGFGPQFEMCPEDDPDHPIVASSATACHCVVLKAVNKARGRDASNTGSGPEFFGFSHPTIQYLIQSLPGARKCTKYQWVKFELPKPQSKQDPDMGPLTLASTITPLSSPGLCSPSPSTQLEGLEHDTEMDPGLNPLMSSPTRSAFPTSLSGMPLSPTAAGQASFVLPPTSPLFGNSSGFPGTGIPDSPPK